MRALILSVSAGGGHKHAALAVKDYILKFEPGSEIKILDTIRYINPILNKVLVGGYLNTLKITPSLFGKIYKFTEDNDKDASISSFKSKLTEIMAYKILPAINNFKPDIIICTHWYPVEMVSILKKKNKINIPIVCIITDYAPHSFWIYPQVDSYIVSNNDMIEEMVHRGINKNSIFDLGIPVLSGFFTLYDKDETLRELKLDPNKKVILIMGGSLGMGRISSIYSQLADSTENIQIIVVAGRNKRLYTKLTSISKNSKVETRILGFTKDVNKYMQCSDVLITKPGGLTISEALICKIPLVLFSPIPGQEEKNEEFLLKHNLGISIGDGTNCKEKIEKLLFSPKTLELMKHNCMKFSKPNCGYNIFNVINDLIKRREIAIMKNDLSDDPI
ncbi:glycosyltransferase [Clostridium sp.]|jgi:processive 1,2-diacylglycerol beta-glucosyltransferase|uniref:MGDG synthase family glycosyltransferase n=1 Tax=Clostridium sp. TaxID=1506 RepID=UPI002586949D|nr:glycosyltransferase [Clostridium sp.]MDF2505251.1 UDP-N-acetylglucosamine:LPS N-acetylglucosamine transferase [Clostridium sp.]